MHITPFDASTLDLAALQKPQGHKYDHGHALILSGGPGRTGAARLAARAALRIGAGAVTLGVPPAAQMEVAAHVTAVMLARIADDAAFAALLRDTRLNALCLGPGLGLRDAQRDLVDVALHSGRPCVLDADALTLIAAHPPLFALLHAGCVLTPHGGEFVRLFPGISAQLTQGSLTKAQATLRAAERAGCVVLLKGAETYIALPDGTCLCHAATGARATPWLATAGAGDVLAGFIAGLLARQMTPLAATQAAVFLHVACARGFGPGLIAEDLSEQLPKVLRDLGL